jgi:hypothetical protein
MTIIKFANLQFTLDEIHDVSIIEKNASVSNRLLNPSKISDIDDETKNRFVKFAQKLKKVAPKSNDFVFFSCVMLHSAEASLVDEKGTQKTDRFGKPVTAEWVIDKKTGSWKWKCSDTFIKPYKNNNGDIFPEPELKKAYRKWIGRPLCKDHQSSSVDGIRGIIVDTYYDDKKKRVIGLCALDKVNYPDLARKITSGYATDVSMGTAVQQSICFECGNVAKTEKDYCPHVRARTTYGEINIGLSPIELSIVVTGADPQAKLRSVLASLNNYSKEKSERIEELQRAGCVTPDEFLRLEREISSIKDSMSVASKMVFASSGLIDNLDEATRINTLLQNPNLSSKAKENLLNLLEQLLVNDSKEETNPANYTGSSTEMSETGYGEQSHDATNPEWAPTGKKVANLKLENQLEIINNRLAAMETALREITIGVQENKTKEEPMSTEKELRERAAARRANFHKEAYHLGGGGVSEPQTYPVDSMNDELKEKGDKQMSGQGMESGKDGLHPGYESTGDELKLKEKYLRAELENRKLSRHAFLSKMAGDVEVEKGTKANVPGLGDVAVVDSNGKKKLIQLNSDGTYCEVKEDQIQAAKDLVSKIDQLGYDKKAYLLGGGGVSEPQTYPVDSMNDELKEKGDKQMSGQGMESGKDGLHPGYESTGDELKLKEKYLRAKLRAKFVEASDKSGKVDKENSYWNIYAGSDLLLTATGSQVYENELNDNWNVFASEDWGRAILREIRENGIKRVATMLGTSLKKTALEMPAMPPVSPMPPMPGKEITDGVEPKEEVGKTPVDESLDSLTTHLEEAEKSLGDLRDAVEELDGKGPEAELDSAGVSAADDERTYDMTEKLKQMFKVEKMRDPSLTEEEFKARHQEHFKSSASSILDKFNNVFANLDESADELAMLVESLSDRKKLGKTSDEITSEIISLSKDAIAENIELRKEASLIVESAKKIKEDKKKKKENKKNKETEEVEEVVKGKGKGKLTKEMKEEECECEEKAKKGKKTKAEIVIEKLIKARAEKRGGLLKKSEDEKEIREIIKEELDKIFQSVGGVENFVKEEEEEEEHEKGSDEMVKIDIDENDDDDVMYDDDSEVAPKDTLMENVESTEDKELDDMLKQFDKEESFDEETLASGKAWRERVAAEVSNKYKLTLSPAVTSDTTLPLGKTVSLPVDNKTDENAIEGIEEMHEKIMQTLHKFPKVKAAMDHLGQVLKSGKLSLSDLENENKLKALAVDSDAAKYWKEYFSQADAESKEFVSDLLKGTEETKKKSSLDEERVKMARAYDLALEMQERGLIEGGTRVLHAQVDDLMKMSNESFESFKRAAARVAPTIKTAARALNVGLVDNSEVEQRSVETLVDTLKKIWK